MVVYFIFCLRHFSKSKKVNGEFDHSQRELIRTVLMEGVIENF